MPRPQIVIENPILNKPFAAPTRHFRFDDDGITDEIEDGRRPSSYFMPIPKAKKKAGQLVFDEWTGDRIDRHQGHQPLRRLGPPGLRGQLVAGGSSDAGQNSETRSGARRSTSRRSGRLARIPPPTWSFDRKQ